MPRSCPDYGEKATIRKLLHNPVVGLEDFTRCMNRRIEYQVRGSWSYSYMLWNMNFRKQLNESRSVYAARPSQEGNTERITTEVIAQACQEIVRALRGHYTTPEGKSRPVQGDITKALYSPALSPVARRLLYNVSAISRDIPGTHEIRRLARSMTKSFIVAYGLPTFITFTADENQNAIFLRLFRIRGCDPALTKGDPTLQQWAERLEPPLTSWGDRHESSIPKYEVRRRIMTNSALSANDGFRVHIRLLFKCFFGMRI